MCLCMYVFVYCTCKTRFDFALLNLAYVCLDFPDYYFRFVFTCRSVICLCYIGMNTYKPPIHIFGRVEKKYMHNNFQRLFRHVSQPSISMGCCVINVES